MGHQDTQTLTTLRRMVLLLLCMGLVGTTTELWLIGHHEDFWQWVPLAVMVVTTAAVLWFVAMGSPAALASTRFLLLLLVICGAIGAVLHYRANMEFQLEMDPSLSGLALMGEVLHAKAPPSLAPGNMVLLGLIGLAATWRSVTKS